jgi:hypothetical protein
MTRLSLNPAHRRLLELQSELMNLRARYDCGQVSPAVYRVIRDLETDIAWADHRQREGATI